MEQNNPSKPPLNPFSTILLQSPLPTPLSTLPPTLVFKEKSIAAFGNDLLTVGNHLLTMVNVFLALANVLFALASIPACLSKYTYLP